MDISKLPLFETMRERLSFLTARQTVLSENVANANTPGYDARDVEAPDFAALAAGEATGGATTLAITNPGHMTARSSGAEGFRIKEMPDAESTPNGNSVNLEDQMMKVSSVQMDYATVTQLYKKAMGMIRIAAGGQR